jgi:hypothetical protein
MGCFSGAVLEILVIVGNFRVVWYDRVILGAGRF